MTYTYRIFAFCSRCGARRTFDRVSKAGYACTICKAPKPKASPIIQRFTR